MEVGEVIVEKTFYKRSAAHAFVEDPSCHPDREAYGAFEEFAEFDEDYRDSDYVESLEGDGRRGPSERCHNRELGIRGENASARYLGRMGFEIIERKWVCPAGEADIIARDGDTLVFIEVKTRSRADKGFPEEAVDSKKRKRYEQIAIWYLKDYGEVDIPVRFDVISMLALGKNRAFMKHYVNAFGVMGH